MLQHPTIHEELMRLRYQELLDEARREQLATQARAGQDQRRFWSIGSAFKPITAFVAKRRKRRLRRLAIS